MTPSPLVERLRDGAKQNEYWPGGAALMQEAADEIERLQAAQVKANNEWRLDYNRLAIERDTQHARAEQAEAEIERLQAEKIELAEHLDRVVDLAAKEVQRANEAAAEIERLLDKQRYLIERLRAALSGKGET